MNATTSKKMMIFVLKYPNTYRTLFVLLFYAIFLWSYRKLKADTKDLVVVG